LSNTQRDVDPLHRAGTAHRLRGGRTARGFTLLEVLLVLLLMALLLVAIAMAVDLQLRVANLGRRHVEEAQLARTILLRIADDIRRAVCEPPTAEGGFSTGASSGSSQGADDRSADEGLEEMAMMAAGSTDELLGTMSLDMGLDTGTTSAEPGIYGGSDWIEIHASRAAQPALVEMVSSGWSDQLDATGSSTEGENLLGDVKTVIYALSWGPTSTELATSATVSSLTTLSSTAGYETSGVASVWGLSMDDLPPGLYRREVDRAVARWADQQGLSETISEFYESDLLALEVESLAFAYFDGSQWCDSWDTQALGGLPVAVEILLTINMEPETESEVIAPSAEQLAREQLVEEPTVYRLVVYLPTGGTKSDESGQSTEASAGQEEAAEGETERSESGSSGTQPGEQPASAAGGSTAPGAPGTSTGAPGAAPSRDSGGESPRESGPPQREDSRLPSGRR